MSQDRTSELRRIARRLMEQYGFEPDFSAAATEQLRAIGAASAERGGEIRDLRDLLWCSIDNDDSLDLDQLSVAEPQRGGAVRILVAIADVDALVPAGSPIAEHARANTTSVYTAAQIFPMLPERLSTDLTSLAEGKERLSLVVDMTVTDAGSVAASEVYRAVVVNRAKLAYDSVAAWLEGKGPAPPRVAAVSGMEQQLRIQDSVARTLKRVRQERGALGLMTPEARAVRHDGVLTDLCPEQDNRAKELIEYFMIAANEAVACFLEERHFPSLRRALREPERWPRIVELARAAGESLPPAPDARALSAFLTQRQRVAPDRFEDLSLSIVKLLGAAEYVLKRPGEAVQGHFGLSLEDYTHATAPNRRFPDLITQRLVKAALAGRAAPWSHQELGELAAHCSEQEGNASKVERRVRKSAAAMLLGSRVGQPFEAVVTGVSEKGVWVRIRQPFAEGRLVRGFDGLDVGDAVHVKLVATDVERGYIDFARAG